MPNFAQGFNNYVGTGVQTSALTTPQAAAQFQTIFSESLKKNQPGYQRVPAARFGREFTMVQRGRSDISGGINFPLIPDEAGAGIWLAMLMGNNNSVTTTDTSAYTHVLSQMREQTAADKPAYGSTIEVLRGSVDNTLLTSYIGCFLNKYSLSIKNDGGVVEGNAEFVGAKEVIQPTISTPSYSTKKPFEGWQTTISYGSNLGSLSTISNFTDANVSISNNIKMLPSQNGSQLPVAASYGMLDAMLDFTMWLQEDVTFYNYFINQTTFAVRLKITSDELAGASSAYHSIQFDFPAVMMVGDIPNLSGPDAIPHKVSLQAFKGTGSYAYTAKVTVVNKTSGAYSV